MGARILLIVLAAVVAGFNILFVDSDPFSWVVMGLVDLFLGTFIVAAWRRVSQDRRDAEALDKARRDRTWQ